MGFEELLNCPTELAFLQIEITTWCNLKCGACGRTVDTAHGRWTNRHISAADFESIISTAPRIQTLYLQGVGEPTLHPELARLIGFARRSGKVDTITFNSNLLARDEASFATLRDAGLSHIYVSVDSLTPEVAALCRAGTDVAKLKEQISTIGRIVPLAFTMVVGRDNLEDLPATWAYLNERGVETPVDLQRLSGNPDRTDGRDPELRPEDFLRFRQILAEGKTRFPFLSLRPSITMLNPHACRTKRCPWPFTRPFVTADGFLTPCCALVSPEIYGHTSVAAAPFADAWGSAPVQDWLRAYLDEESPLCPPGCIGGG